MKTKTLSPELLRKTDAYWHAAVGVPGAQRP